MPRKPDTRVTMNVRLPPDLKDELVQAAEDRCVGQNLIVERAIRYYLSELASLADLPRPAPTPEVDRYRPPGPTLTVGRIATDHLPIVPILEATETGVYLPCDNGDGTVTMDWSGAELADDLPTVYADPSLRMESIAPGLPGINVVIGPKPCRQLACEEDATAGPWCPAHLRALLEHPDPENGR